jgi:thioredoxin reductase (NADPH)
MESNGTRIVQGAQPASIEKLPSGKLLVRFTDGASDEFDTVLAAVGRTADTAKLGLESVGVAVNPKTLKMTCTNEQSNVPHIYGIGDVVDGTPELTPVAILAGKLLAQRLYADNPQLMSYKDIATTVFTPLELGTIGYSEEDAIAKFGAAAVDCFVSAFTPLELSVVDSHTEGGCFAKVVVNTQENNKIIGMHIAAPNAGEIIQGFAVAFRKGMTHQDLLDTVGIHPTTAEEFTTMVSQNLIRIAPNFDASYCNCAHFSYRPQLFTFSFHHHYHTIFTQNKKNRQSQSLPVPALQNLVAEVKPLQRSFQTIGGAFGFIKN